MIVACRTPLLEREQTHFGPIYLLTTVVSAFAAVVGLGMAFAGEGSALPLQVATGLLAALLFTSAAWITGAQAVAEARWRRRLAPSAAAGRVRRGFRVLLIELVACVAAGPAVMLLSLAFVRPLHEMPGLVAATLLSLAAALVAGSAWGQRASVDERAPWQRLRALVRRMLGGWRRWRRVPTETDIARGVGTGGDWVWMVWLPQCLTQGSNWRFQAWDAPLVGGWVPAWAGVWMFALCAMAGSAMLGPPLHWRARLAPGGVGPAAWSWQMLRASLASALGAVVVALALGAAFTSAEDRAAQISGWLPAAADALLAMAWVLWLRGWRNTGPCHLWAALGLALGVSLSLWAAQALGFAPQRGWLLLTLELAATGALALAAQRAWARQDLNRLTIRR